MKLDHLFISRQLQKLGPKEEMTGMFKLPVTWANVSLTGLEGDKQGDLRVHGGPEKAVHQYASSSYRTLAKQFPLLTEKLVPGAMGENLTVEEMSDVQVCIGDIYQIGRAVLQVSQPRQPCHKIGLKFEENAMHSAVGKQGITGWYYRVLSTGQIHQNDDVTLLERPNPEVNVSSVMQMYSGQIQDARAIEQAMAAQGLTPKWITKLEKRLP